MIELFPEGFEEREVGAELELAAYTTGPPASRLHELGAVSTGDVEPGWEDGWREFHRPVRIGPLWIGPPWQEPEPGALAVVIDPGRAFGTGAHPTTRLCLELLLECEPGSVVDLGCGSGVLAIAAARLGFRPVTALDLDEAAVAASRANAAANDVRIEVRRSDVLVDPLPDAGTGIANIAAREIEAVAPRFRGRTLVVSGFLAEAGPRLAGWRSRARRELEGWAAELLERF